jgi:cytochrome o ubiquinol oxidase subunit III
MGAKMTTQTLTGVEPGEDRHADTIANQVLGFWLYMMSDLVVFGTLFATYAVLGHNYAGGPAGRELFHLPDAFFETMLLLISSVTYGMVMLAVNRQRKAWVVSWLIVTFMFGLGFVGMEINEFQRLLLAGHGPQRSGFLSAFFTLVGTHGSHVIAGLVWMAVMIGQVSIKGLIPSVQSRLIRLSIFWHFLDIVWVGVFTLVYLMGVM